MIICSTKHIQIIICPIHGNICEIKDKNMNVRGFLYEENEEKQ